MRHDLQGGVDGLRDTHLWTMNYGFTIGSFDSVLYIVNNTGRETYSDPSEDNLGEGMIRQVEEMNFKKQFETEKSLLTRTIFLTNFKTTLLCTFQDSAYIY